MSFIKFRALTFDVYGTLIDWEAGILAQLRPFAERAGLELDDEALLSAFAAVESRWEADHPGMPYSTLLAAVHRDLQRGWGVGQDEAAAMAFGASVPEWPAFPDSAGAMARLKKHFQLFALSNVDNRSIAGSLPAVTIRDTAAIGETEAITRAIAQAALTLVDAPPAEEPAA